MRTRGVSKDRSGKGLSTWDGFIGSMASWKVNFFLCGVILSSRLREIGADSVSLRKKKATNEATREKIAGIAQGRK